MGAHPYDPSLLIGIASWALPLLAFLYYYKFTYRLGDTLFLGRKDLARAMATFTRLPKTYIPRGWFSGIDGLQVFGQLPSGRSASVCIYGDNVAPEGWRWIQYLTSFAIVTDDTPLVRVREETLFTRIAKVAGRIEDMEIGDEEFDRRFVIESPDPERTRKAFRGELQKAIVRAFDLGARELTIGGRRLEVKGPIGAIAPREFGRMLDALEAASRTFDRKTLTVHVLGGERSALVDATGRTRCPYCHGGITGEEADLVACDQCATVLHDGCWAEHGGCPLLGCTGRAPERARVR
jgi:hypothetical protein